MDLEILTVGTELVLGFTLDSNAADIAQTCAQYGIVVSRCVTVGDSREAIASAMAEGLERSDVVLVTGGLGPTPDDVTRLASGDAGGVTLELDHQVLEQIRRRFAALGRSAMPESNRVQAMIPRGAIVLANTLGTAPGLWLETRRGVLVMLPGVPREMRALLRDAVIPRLVARSREQGGAGWVVRSLTVRTTGVAESTLVSTLAGTHERLGAIRLAYLPTLMGVDLRLTGGPGTAEEIDEALRRAAEMVRAVVGGHVYGTDSDDIARVVLGLLRDRGFQLAVAESCTGGLVGARLTAIEGASDVFRGGVVSYADRSKERDLGVPAALLERHGAVSEEVVVAMVDGVRDRFRTETGLAVSGVAGPTGGTADKPVGTVCLAASIGDEARVVTRRFPGDRAEVRERAAQAALDLARRLVLDGAGASGGSLS